MVEEFRRRAEETEAFARRLGPAERGRYLDYAATWRALADEIEARDRKASDREVVPALVGRGRP